MQLPVISRDYHPFRRNVYRLAGAVCHPAMSSEEIDRLLGKMETPAIDLNFALDHAAYVLIVVSKFITFEFMIGCKIPSKLALGYLASRARPILIRVVAFVSMSSMHGDLRIRGQLPFASPT